MRSDERPGSPFVPVDTPLGTVMLRAPRYGLAVDYDGEPYLQNWAGSILIGQRVVDFIDEPIGGTA